jgi:Ran GTPase-activating protein (RanGAP) involved in mRNA processing and transport
MGSSQWWKITFDRCSARLKKAIMKEFCSRWVNSYWFNNDRVHQISLNCPCFFPINKTLLLSILERCTSITSLMFVNTKFDTYDLNTIAGALSGLKSLQILHLDLNIFNETIIKAFQPSLSSHNSLRLLSLINCSLDDTRIVMLSKALPQSLIELRLGDNLFTSNCLRLLTAALLKLNNLEILNLDGVKLEKIGSSIISEYIESEDCKLKSLSINQTGIGNNEFKVVLNGLKMSGLKSISINDLNTNEEGFAILVKFLKELPTEDIYFRDNIITENVFLKLRKAIQDSKVRLMDVTTKKCIIKDVTSVTTEFYKIIV